MTGLPLTMALRRFPVAAAAAVALGVALLAAAPDFDLPQDRFVGGSAAAFFAAIAGQSLGGRMVSAAAALTAAALIAFATPLWVTAWLLVAALALGALVAPAAAGPRDAGEAWRRLARSATAAGLGILGALVVIAGVVLLALGTDVLLGLDWSDLAWDVVTPLALGWLAPAVFLSLAGADGDGRIAEALGLVAQTFARLVLTPLLAVYAAVLALYVGRIAVLSELPSGEIGWIVPLFGATGAVTVLALSALPEPGGATRLFLRAWFPVTVVPVALYAVALAIRIDAYGITPERYLAILLGVWLGALALAFSLGPRGGVRLIPVTLALVLALGAVGPWSLKPVVVKSLGDRIAASLPADEGGVLFHQTPPDARRAVCSPVAELARLGMLGHVESRLGVDRLAAACADPWQEEEGAEIIILGHQGPHAFATEAAAAISGPYWFYGDNRTEHPAAGLRLEVSGAALVIRADGDSHAVDLVAVAREWRERGGDEPYAVRRGGLTVVFADLMVTVSPDAARANQLTLYVARDR